MTRYGEDILDDRGPHPNSPGELAFDRGQSITLEATEQLTAGQFVTFDGSGGVGAAGDLTDTGHVDAVVRHDAASGDDVTVHTYGVVRVTEDATAQDHVTKVAGFSGSSDILVKLN